MFLLSQTHFSSRIAATFFGLKVNVFPHFFCPERKRGTSTEGVFIVTVGEEVFMEPFNLK
jgi:hypothetical protein